MSYADFFQELKTKYNIQKCGFALTSIEELDMCTYLDEIDIVQFPLNYYNFKPEYEQKLQSLRDQGITLVGRTPFDRGLLTIKNEITSGGKSGVNDANAREKKKAICEKYGISEIELALWFLKDFGLLDSILFSSFNIEHLTENINVFNADVPQHFSWRNIVKDLRT
jgi:aryl-alcohol dehydrogenase-like predicted oxidoreductase